MRPVHELTEDQAVLELEEVCDTLADPTSGLNTEPLRKRKAELERLEAKQAGACWNWARPR